jgi:putative transposase
LNEPEITPPSNSNHFPDGTELTAHLGYEKGDPAGHGTGNIRNGYSEKTLKTDDGTLEI